MNNPYEPPTTATTPARDDRRARIALIPFLIAVPCIVAACILWFWQSPPAEPFNIGAVAFGAVFAILVFDIPVCVLVLVQWLVTGEPPELSLSPLIPSREEREFLRDFRSRPKLSGEEFYEKFYANSGIPKQLPVQMRTLLADVTGLDLGALQPTDNLHYADAELDWGCVIERIHREFGVVVCGDFIGEFDGTFDSLLRCVAGLASTLPGSGCS